MDKVDSIVDFKTSYRLIDFFRKASFFGSNRICFYLRKWLLPKPDGTILHKNLAGSVLYIDPKNDTGVEHALYQFGIYEAGTIKFIQNVLEPGDCAIDVGANIGLMSIAMAQAVGAGGQVLAFEAHPETAQILQKNIARNSVTQVQLHNIALGETESTLTLFSDLEKNRGAASLDANMVQSSAQHQVAVKTLDSFSLGKVKLVKIDVEGWEVPVLKGAQDLLDQDIPPILILECTNQGTENRKKEIFDFIQKTEKYTIWKMAKGKEIFSKLEKIESPAALPDHENIFCMPKKIASQIGE